MYFGTKSYLKSNRYHTAKHALKKKVSTFFYPRKKSAASMNYTVSKSFKTRPGLAGRPRSVVGPSLGKKQAGNWPGQTRSTRRVNPGPGQAKPD